MNTKTSTKSKTTKRTTTPTIMETQNADNDDLEPGVVDDVFVERLARRCETHLGKWLDSNAPGQVRDLYSSTIWLRHYVTAYAMRDSRVHPVDNREVTGAIITAVNACTVAGDVWDTL